jgi:hypothetical protein
MALLINEGIFASGDVVHDADLIEKVRRQAASVQLMLRSCGCAPGCDGGRAAIDLVHRVVIADEDASGWLAADIGNLVQGLEALRKLFHIRTDGSWSV